MSYYVTFHLNNGQPDYVDEVEEGQIPEAPDDPVREGYYFEGFYTDQMLESEWDWSQPAMSSYDVYGKWTAAGGEDETVDVTLNPANGDQPGLLRLAAGSTLPEWVLTDLPTWEGHRCTGWTLGNEPVDEETTFGADASLTAAWVVTHEVTFDPANGEAVTVQTVDDGDSAEMPDDPVRDGYLFLGWQSGGSDYAFGPVTADVTVTAAWEVTGNTDDDGSGEEEPADASDVADSGTYDEGTIDTTDPTDIPFTPTTPDTSANVGEAGEVNPDGVPATPEIFEPAQLVAVTRYSEEYIQDYSPTSLAALEASGAVPIAVYDDGTEVQVTWVEVAEPVIAHVTASSEAAAVAAATNQHFWNNVEQPEVYGGAGVHVTDDEKDRWVEYVGYDFFDLGAPDEVMNHFEQFELDGKTKVLKLFHDVVGGQVAVLLNGAPLSQNMWSYDGGKTVTLNSAFQAGDEVRVAANFYKRPWHNILMNSLGILLRTGLRNLVSITRSAIAFFDGQGNDAANAVASFGTDGAQIGKTSGSNVSITGTKVSINKANDEIIKFGTSEGDYAARHVFTFTSADVSYGQVLLDLPTAPVTSITYEDGYLNGHYENPNSSMSISIPESDVTLYGTRGRIRVYVPTVADATYTLPVAYTYSGAKPYMEFGPRDNAEYPGSHQVRLDWIGNIAMGPVLRQYADANNAGSLRFRSENRDGMWARFYGADDSNGDAVVLGAGGLFVAGGGESAPNLYNNHLKEHLALTPGNESTWLSADSYLRIVTNANSVSKTDASMLYVWDFAANGETTFPGTVILPKRQDASGTANNSPALIVGGTASQSHIEIDDNEIQAKASATTTTTLGLNADGGAVTINGHRVMLSENTNNFWGLMTPEGAASTWIRTTSVGLIPYASGGSSSSLGTAGWPFNNVRAEHLYAGATVINENAATTTTVSTLATAATGFSITNCTAAVWGKVCTFMLTIKTTDGLAAGNITNTLVATLKAGYRPAVKSVLSAADTGPVLTGHVLAGGGVYVDATHSAVAAEGSFSIGGTIVLA